LFLIFESATQISVLDNHLETKMMFDLNLDDACHQR
jgi:hypothetical protein